MCELWALAIIALRIAPYHSQSLPILRIPKKSNSQSINGEDSDKETESDRRVKSQILIPQKPGSDRSLAAMLRRF
jgi:hypothetical protein